MTVGELRKIIALLPDNIEITNRFEQIGTTIAKVSACVTEAKKWHPCVEESAEQYKTVQVLVIS